MKIPQRLILFFSTFYFLLSTFSYAQDEIIPAVKFKNADIRVVLQAIAQKASRDSQKINIIVSPQVEGLVSINLENVSWFTALGAVLKSHDYDYQWIGKNIILVDVPKRIEE